MDSDLQDTGSIFESKEDAVNPQAEEAAKMRSMVSTWLQAIALADKEEKDWRKAAEKSDQIYAMEEDAGKSTRYNILFSNVETISPALYNSVPIPDVRERYNDDGGIDPQAQMRAKISKQAAQVLERAISFNIDDCNFDECMKQDVFDMVLPGRGISFIQYKPMIAQDGQSIAFQSVYPQHIQWKDFRHGPGKVWHEVPWVACRLRMTREQLRSINPEIADRVKLDCAVDGFDEKEKSDAPPDIFKRAEVWMIWDKESAKVIFIAPSYTASPLSIDNPPFNVKGFFPCPAPLQYIMRTTSLVPIEPYRIYAQQADELNTITKRLTACIKVMKFRGVRSTQLGDTFEKIKDLVDGEFAPVDDAFEMMVGNSGLDNSIWVMPIEKLIGVVEELSNQRERCKQVIYELCGVADIMRGQSDASETLGAQELKTQWGTLRMQNRQRAVQNYARDMIRLMAEIIAENFTPEVLTMMTGIQVTPEVMQLLKSDIVRQYRIDIETDSTIRADVSQAQKNIGDFMTGLAQFMAAVGPAVQQGAMPPEVAIEMLTSFAGTFKLGRQVEAALDAWKQKIVSMAMQQSQGGMMGLPPQAPGMPPVGQSPMMGHNGAPPMNAPQQAPQLIPQTQPMGRA